MRNPGMLAAAIELDLERFRRAGVLVQMPPSMAALAEALDRVATMLREADDLGQSVDLGDEVVRLIQQFRGALCAFGGALAQA